MGPTTTRGLGGGEAAAWMLENRLRGIADEEIKRQVCNPMSFCLSSNSSLLPCTFCSSSAAAPYIECKINSNLSHRGRKKLPWTRTSPWRWSQTRSYRSVHQGLPRLICCARKMAHFICLRQVRPVREGRRYLLWRKITG